MNLEITKILANLPVPPQKFYSRANPAEPKHNGLIRGFYILSESWYADANRRPGVVDSIMIGFYGKDGDAGTSGEFEVEWTELGGSITPQLQAFDDSWHALSQFHDLLEVMAEIDSRDVAPKTFAKILIALGIKDLTKRERG